MFYKVKSLKGYALDSLDGPVGSVDQFYFDDKHWAVRYLVAETKSWLAGREVLLSPHALASVDEGKRRIAVDLTKAEIEGAPSPETHLPVSRQFETSYYGYYGWPTYWSGPYMWGGFSYVLRDRKTGDAAAPPPKHQDSHLRSTDNVSGYNVEAKDGGIGHIEDFIVDDKTWAIRYVVVATRNWWPGKKVLLSTRWIERVSWGESKVHINLTREAIQNAPEYKGDSPLTYEYEEALHRFHKLPGYWAAEAVVRS